VHLEDVSDAYGILAVQGPRSAAVLRELVPETDQLGYFDHVAAKIGPAAVTLSRTGYTGDLGYEITVEADQAVDVLDAVLQAGRPHSLRPFGEEALMMLRIEAGLPLIDVEWTNSRTAFSDAQRVTPTELGMGWMLRGAEDGGRPFVGRDAIRRELRDGTSRWSSVGIVVDWADWDRLHREAGLLPAKDEQPLGYESMMYDDRGDQVGYATSFLYSPVLQRHVGLARVRPSLAPPGTALRLETSLLHHNTTVAVTTTALPHFKPARKTATPS
jgi:aminomethyltransferase